MSTHDEGGNNLTMPHPENEPFRKDGYTLYRRDIVLPTGRAQPVYFFARLPEANARACTVPPGYEVTLVARTGTPVLRRRRESAGA